MSATPKEIGNYLDDFKAGLDAGPAGSVAFREAVHHSQEQRKGVHALDVVEVIEVPSMQPGDIQMLVRDPAIAAHAAAEAWFTEANHEKRGPIWRALAPDFFRAIVRNPQGFKSLMAEVKAQEDLILNGDPSAQQPVGILSSKQVRRTSC